MAASNWQDSLKRFTEDAMEIAFDAGLTTLLILCFSGVDEVLQRFDTGEAFKLYFAQWHMWSVLGSLVVVSVKSLYRLAFR